MADEYHDKLMDIVSETSDELMERYLEGDEISREEMAAALKNLVTEGELFPVGCGAATRNIGAHGLLDLVVEGLPSPARARNVPEVGGANTLAYVFKTVADPFSGKINLMRVYAGTVSSDSNLTNNHSHAKERVGQLLQIQGKEHTPVDRARAGIHRRRGKAQADQHRRCALGLRPSGRDRAAGVSRAGGVVCHRAAAQGRRGQGHQALRRLAEEDPALDIHRDPDTGEMIVSGLSQMHVEVTVDRVSRRFGVELDLHPPRVPYMETIRKPARARAKYKKQTGGRGQFGDCEIHDRAARLTTRATSSSTRSSAG